MPHPLHDSRLKLNRSHDHLEALKQEFAAFVARKPYRVACHFDAESGCYILRARVFEQPPPAWGAALGDFLQNARACLDFIAHQLVLLNKNEPTRRTQFPLFATPQEFAEKAPGQMAGVSDRHARMIEACQPYPTSKFSPLRELNALSNTDKHSVLTLRATSLRSFGFALFRPDGMRIPTGEAEWSFAGAWDALEDGAEIVRVSIEDASTAEPQVTVDAEHSIVVSLSEGSMFPDVADNIYQAVEDVFDLFVNEFPIVK
jgi:hypothetical protein